jgi:putative transcriptional regulator
MIRRHPESELLVEYTAGSLSLAPTISVTTHLQFCDECQSSVASLNEIGGRLLESEEKISVSGDLLDRVLDCIDNPTDESPATEPAAGNGCSDEATQDLPRYVKSLLPEGELPWRRLTSSLNVSPLSVGEEQYELALHRIEAGGKTPHHDHRGREITVVLKGSFSDEDGVYHPGDFLVREPGDRHRPIAASNEDCICLSVLEAPIRLTGLKRVLNPFLSFVPG